MSKAIKVLLGILIFVCTILATSTGFFYAKSSSLQKKVNESPKTTDELAASSESVVSETTKKNKTEEAVETTDTTSTVSASSSDSRPSSPSDTVVVGDGETLFEIGQKVGVSYLLIAEASGIDADKIAVGQTLIVPKNNQIGFTINKDKAASLQEDVDSGKYAFRLSALDTAKADSPTAYGLASTDSFVKGTVDATAGSGTVTVTKGDKTYTITLIQPVTKGDKGIWAIDSIKPKVK